MYGTTERGRWGVSGCEERPHVLPLRPIQWAQLSSEGIGEGVDLFLQASRLFGHQLGGVQHATVGVTSKHRAVFFTSGAGLRGLNVPTIDVDDAGFLAAVQGGGVVIGWRLRLGIVGIHDQLAFGPLPQGECHEQTTLVATRAGAAPRERIQYGRKMKGLG